jgi:hypothetical protein
MIIKANSLEIPVSGVHSTSIQSDGKSYPALRFEFPHGVSEDELSALCSGNLEIVDDNGKVQGVHIGYTTRRGLSFVVGKIETAEQKLAETEAALAAEEAKKPYIDTLIVALDDATASTVIPLFGGMKYDGKMIETGTRINWNGALKRAAVDLWDRADSNPDNAPALWEDILYRDGIRIIPEVITAGLAFSNGERGWWGDVLYESKADNNVYTPEQYAEWWEVVEE